jgi:PqqD family protein of HPr-rel-A system
LARFQIKHFDDEAALFDTASGDTHVLSALATVLYSICLEAPTATLTDMQARVAARFDLAPADIPLADIDDALTHLRRIGLLATP